MKNKYRSSIVSVGSCNSIIVNGKHYKGNSVIVEDNCVIIDGKVQSEDVSGNIQIIIEGNVDSIETSSGSVRAKNVGNIQTVSGDVTCADVSGNVTTVSGDVDCKEITGNVSTISGDITS
jgi:predicted thioredoxin/glutaredoxin